MTTKEVKLELPDGSIQTIVLRRICRKERKELNKLITPEKFNPQNPVFEVKFENWETYQDKLLEISIVSPKIDLQNMESAAFDLLFAAAQELNGEVKNLADNTEKK